jgi:hypothetical protein
VFLKTMVRAFESSLFLLLLPFVLSSNGDSGYQQYYQQYIGGSSPDRSSDKSDKSSQAASSSYQKYYQQYTGAQGGSSGYQQYYQQYVGGGAKGDASTSGGYQQYYQQYVGGSQSGSSRSAGAGYDQYYQQYIGGDDQGKAGDESAARAKTSVQGHNSKSTESSAMGTEVAPPASVDFLASMPPMLLAELTKCTTKKCVEEWRKKNEDGIKKYVPKDYQHFALAAIEKKCKQELARIEATKNATNTTNTSARATLLSTLQTTDESELAVLTPIMLAKVASCSTKKCLEEWRNASITNIKKFVPKDYQRFPLASIEKEYKKNLARVEALKHSNVTSSSHATKPAEELKSGTQVKLKEDTQEAATDKEAAADKQKASRTNVTGIVLAAGKSESRPIKALSITSVALLSLVAGSYAIRLRSWRRTDGVEPSLEEDLLKHPAMLAA